MRRWLARLVLKIFGWKLEGSVPSDVPKAVILCVPHTSNWDFFWLLMAGTGIGIRFQWYGKKELFKPPFGWLVKAFGGVPIDRSRPQDIVANQIAAFNQYDSLYVCIPPEGTRKRVEYWKTGFYYIARGAGVPVIPGYLDYKARRTGVGPPMTPSDDIEADIRQFAAYYAGMEGKYNEHHGPIRIKPKA